MKNVGVRFEIPNEYGNYLSNILESLPVKCYQWLVDDDEIYLLKNNQFTNEFLFNDDRIISGEKLYESSKNNTYYMIFVTLRAFSKDGTIKAVSKYKDFLESDCQIMLSVYDCSYVVFWCKDSQLVSNMYEYALSKGYEYVEYIEDIKFATDDAGYEVVGIEEV
ncbi:DUF2691 family protein [Clostridium sp.]|jgi:hypothetical protein|uniref:DUF2691 family protein n=1 Tax=Clostridium sp. TaxID=1506 RepID=UPI0039F643B9